MNARDFGKLTIGFPLSRGDGGPTVFMRRLREAVRVQGLAKVTYFFDPRADILICSNVVRNPWRKPYMFRVDGISFDLGLGPKENARRNAPISAGLENAAGIVFQCRFGASLVDRFLRVPQSPSVIIPNGVDLTEFTPSGPDLRKKLGIAKDEIVFITSAKWRAHKRLESVVQVFDAFTTATGRQARLIVLGQLDRQPTRMPPGMMLIGHIPHKELPAWYRTADILLFFSWLDYCPNTVCEALASGLPVVCTNQGGTRELVEMTNGGIVVEVDDDFTFCEVDLYHPPSPEPAILLKGVMEAVTKRGQIIAGMKREAVGIDAVARRYVQFAEQIVYARAAV